MQQEKNLRAGRFLLPYDGSPSASRTTEVPEGLEAFDTSQGAGKIRLAATVTLAYNLEAVTMRIRKLLERRMGDFAGPVSDN